MDGGFTGAGLPYEPVGDRASNKRLHGKGRGEGYCGQENNPDMADAQNAPLGDGAGHPLDGRAFRRAHHQDLFRTYAPIRVE